MNLGLASGIAVLAFVPGCLCGFHPVEECGTSGCSVDGGPVDAGGVGGGGVGAGGLGGGVGGGGVDAGGIDGGLGGGGGDAGERGDAGVDRDNGGFALCARGFDAGVETVRVRGKAAQLGTLDYTVWGASGGSTTISGLARNTSSAFGEQGTPMGLLFTGLTDTG